MFMLLCRIHWAKLSSKSAQLVAKSKPASYNKLVEHCKCQFKAIQCEIFGGLSKSTDELIKMSSTRHR